MDDIQKETLVREFRAYLDMVDLADEEDDTAPPPDLHTLLNELATLRTEVRTQARQFKTSLDQFREVFDTLRIGYDTLVAESSRRASDHQALRRETLRPLLLQVLDVRDRIVKSLDVLTGLAPPAWWCRESRTLMENLRAGQEMSLRRLDQLLSSYQIRPIEARGQSHNPFTMTVVEIESRIDVAAGIVTEEVRRGFLWNEELLRPADVKVNRGLSAAQNVLTSANDIQG
ncbi:molecular chaperone GrpE [Gammaproteobacteria bacterium]